MKKRSGFLFITFIFLWSVAVWADTYDTHSLVRVSELTTTQKKMLLAEKIDITNARKDYAKVLVTDSELKWLARTGFTYRILHEEMARDRELWAESKRTNAYYTPSAFNTVNPPVGSMMEKLLSLYNSHTSIMRLYDIGDTESGNYDIIAVKVTDNPDVEENEPEIRLYGNIHGDEKSALMVTMDVLDWIVQNYPADDTAKKLVNQAELWFIPMGNPDGNASNSRYNANYVDLNRNFWGPDGHSSGSAPFSEKETQAIRDLTEVMGKIFVTSISFHSGEICFNSVYNYTHDSTTDESIFFSSRTGGPNGGATPMLHGLADAYYQSCTTSGFWYTNGADWYVTNGDTNDWSYYQWSDLDTTLEVTSLKTPSPSQIDTYCLEHRQAVLNYMLKTFQGIHGVMTDVNSGVALDGQVRVTATESTYVTVPHVYKNVLTDPDVGDFHRVLQPGTYTVECICDGYQPVVHTGVQVTADTKTNITCEMNGTYLHYVSKSIDDYCENRKASGDSILDAGEEAIMNITLKNAGITGSSNVQATLSSSHSGVTFTNNIAYFPDIAAQATEQSYAPHFIFTVDQTVPCGEEIPLTLTIQCNEGTYIENFTQRIGYVENAEGIIFSDDFETNKGWTFAGSGEWERAQPLGLGGEYGSTDPSSAYSGSMVLGNDLSGSGARSGDYENSVSTSTARSPQINCSEFTDVQLSFRRWLNVEQGVYDKAKVEISNNGSTWTTVWENTSGLSEGAWGLQTYDVSAVADNQSTVYLRFSIASDTSQRYSGWNIDDVTLSGDGPADCSMDPCLTIVPELNTTGIVFLLGLFTFTMYVITLNKKNRASCGNK